ncbi:C4-dicarboxylate ABC transporter [Alicyclobacillus hesperidum]|uniref:C4-dicarboxylate ABC transporter n=1 Tax=Alicyclobacillus hesperidum TaxID=89784 RepID=A0A1H2X6N5_9BACL|nr:C4-dicarboxylate ABC transporter [Alicyclobacillus hesperidum]GLV14728.1 C4-dicarboxylate ABC transporter [Alicyclobacillus hesperidum]SDW88437.1 C4-dicarboxylate transporter/malic acid transport protein [Alicyclobacillus hesperidum]
MRVVRQFGLNWFTTVMGIGIVAALTYTSPITIPLQHVVGVTLFAALNVVFISAFVMWLLRWVLATETAVDDFRKPGRALFYGAFAMGLNVVGNDYFLIGTHLLPRLLAIHISIGIWLAGTLASLFTVIVVPYLLFAEHRVEREETVASWLIPLVPPIVAAATGTNLLPYVGGSAVQFAMLAVIVAMFGVTFFLFILMSTLVYARLVYHRRLSGQEAPSLWVEIGPIGMSMGTMCGLPIQANHLFGAYANALHAFAEVFAMAMWGIGVWWILISTMHTLLHVTRRGDGLPFHLGWWSYVFPIGSFTSGTYALDHLMGHSFFAIAGVVQLAILWVCFTVVFVRTTMGIVKGELMTWRAVHQLEGSEHVCAQAKRA